MIYICLVLGWIGLYAWMLISPPWFGLRTYCRIEALVGEMPPLN